MDIVFAEQNESKIPERLLHCLIPEEKGSIYSAQQMSLALNRFGTLLCTGCTDGKIFIYDTDTLYVSALYIPFSTPVFRVTFSSCGNYIAAGTMDGNIAVLRTIDGFIVGRRTMKGTCASLEFNPRDKTQLLVSGIADSPTILTIDYDKNEIMSEEHDIVIDVPQGSEEDEGDDEGETEETEETGMIAPIPKKKQRRRGRSNGIKSLYGSSFVSAFGGRGTVVYGCTPQGVLFRYSLAEKKVTGVLQIGPQGLCPSPRSIEVSRQGELLLMNFNDKTIRVIKGDTLEVFFEFKNESSGCSFLRCTFTRDADFIATVSESSQMELQIRSLDGILSSTLTGSFPDKIYDIVWSPCQTLVFTSTSKGMIYVWDQPVKEKWDVYVPAFHEIQENTEYIEREDEFDLPEGYSEKEGKKEQEGPKKKKKHLDIVTRNVVKEYFLDKEHEDPEVVEYCKRGIANEGLLLTIPPVLVEASLQF